ncbi:YheU family protein [Isoalcanivorax beigongshangi]|uniref:YheU family protein n=1 Tax=Isoalcanivorax beigongshangi TaxID=3238810 RepID=A0ABV4AHL8_9GAMM
MQIPWNQIPADTLGNLLEEFVTRDGTDYGAEEVPLTTRVAQVRRQLERGEAVIWFDDATESVSVFSRRELIERGLLD